MHRSVLVKSVQDHHFQGMADKGFKTITLDMPHLDSTNQYNFEPAWDTNNGEAPAAGIHIDCDIKESVTKKGMRFITSPHGLRRDRPMVDRNTYQRQFLTIFHRP